MKMKYVKMFEDFDYDDDQIEITGDEDFVDVLSADRKKQKYSDFDIDRAIKAATSDAENKKEKGQLFTQTPEDFDDGDGDAETLETLASLYSQEVDGMSQEDAENAIYNALAEKFPEFVA